jgi:CRP-like cAMP-binding protein
MGSSILTMTAEQGDHLEVYDLLRRRMNEHVELTDEAFARCLPHFKLLQVVKGKPTLRAGETAMHASFVIKGLFRTYVLDGNGQEHILQFSLPGWWCGDLGSFTSGSPSRFNVEALEDAEILQISRSSWDVLVSDVPAFAQYQLRIMENNLVAVQNRLVESISLDARTRYDHMLAHFPDIFQRVPQYMIASYLGMSRETLSRVRRRQGSGR